MKKIGIKLADGTFYPILEEGEPKTRNLDLTTAKDNQTQVKIDLYRSENDSLDGAEYVDTLVIKHMKKHPEGEPDLHLSIGIDENNELTAKVVDDETGKESEVTCQLISRTLAEREGDDSSDVTSAEFSDDDFEFPETTEETSDSDTTSEDAVDNFTSQDSPLDEPFSFDSIDTNLSDSVFEESEFTVQEEPSISEATTENSEEFSSEEETVDNVDFGDLPDLDENSFEETEVTESEIAEQKEDTEVTDSEDSAVGNVPIVPDFAEGLTDDTFEETSMEDAGDSDGFMASDTETTETETTENEDIFSTDDLDNFTSSDDTDAFADDSSDGFMAGDTEMTETETTENTELNEEDFSLPDFDDLGVNEEETSETTTEETASSDVSFDDFSDDDFSDDEFSTEGIFDDIEVKDPSIHEKATPGSSMDFSDLYDEETLDGETTEEVVERKTRAPVIICIVCAIICLLATALVLFIIPSKYNLLTKNSKSKENVEMTTEKGLSEEDMAVMEAERKAAEEAARQAKISAEKAEAERKAAEEAAKKAAEEAARKAAEIVPVPVEPKPKKEAKKVFYKIKWGDTLWDISESYYKNPWKYKKIASHNGIKNPDYIIAGKTIEIPEE